MRKENTKENIMKSRHGFVSNSSSTSFTFVFKGKKVKDLSDTILKYKEHFNLSFDAGWGDSNDIYNCNALDVASAIESCVKSSKKDKWNSVKVISIDDCLKNIIENKKQYSQYIKEEKDKVDKPNYSLTNIYERHNSILEEQLNKLRAAKKRGLTSVINIGFGDNHGDISGGELGNCMDYEGRYISINNNDFIVFTEQNR